MKTAVDGTPLISVLQNASIAVLKEGGEPTSLAVRDNDTGEVLLIPCGPDQIEAVYADWNGAEVKKKIVLASDSDVRDLVKPGG